MFSFRNLLCCLPAILLSFVIYPQNMLAQSEQPLLLSGSGTGQLMLGAIDRLVIPANGSWQVTKAPFDVFFSPEVWLYDGENIYAGTDGQGLYRKKVVYVDDPSFNTVNQSGSDNQSFDDAASVSYFGQKDGLAGNVVTSLEKQGSNFWVGTDGGLSLVEGRRVVAFSQWNSSLPSGSVNHLVPMPSGDSIWAVTREGGALVNTDLLVIPWSKKGTPPPSGQIMDAALWNNASLVIASVNAIYILNEDVWSMITLDFTPVSLLWVPLKGLLMATVNGLYILDDVNRPPKQVFTTDKITSMALSGEALWVTTDNGVRVAGTVNFLPDMTATRALAGQSVAGGY